LVAPSVLFGSTAEAAPTGILADKGPHFLPKLPYAYEALEPHIDKETMELHHKAHHQAYIDNLNAAVIKTPMEKLTIDAIFKNISKYKPEIRNNAGGHYNHSFFWETLNPVKSIPLGGIDAAIKKKFLSLDGFKAAFSKEAMNVFGSGWVWLCVNKANKDVFIVSTPNQDNPLMELPGTQKGVPIIAIDVWEHAYYLKHQNKRKDYIAAYWNLVDWNKAEVRFQEATAVKGK